MIPNMLRLTTMINYKLQNFPVGDGERDAITVIQDILTAIVYSHRRAYMILISHKDGVLIKNYEKQKRFAKSISMTDKLDGY